MTETVTIKAVGDIFLANLHVNIGFGVGSRLSRNNARLVESASTFLKDADFCTGNLESPLYYSDEKSVDRNCFAGAKSFARFLKTMGINWVNVANNHIMEYGEPGFLNTLRSLDEFGIAYVGASIDGRSSEVIFDVKGTRIGCIGYSIIPEPSSKKCYAWGEPEIILSQIRDLRKRCDHVIIHMHWGDEFILRPSMQQVQLAHRMIDAGAVLVIGHHPHVYQGYETYKNGLIFYSLGNFIFDMHWLFDTRWGVVAQVEFDKQGIVSKKIELLWIDNQYCPVVPAPKDLKSIMERIEKTQELFQPDGSEAFSSERYQESYRKDLSRAVSRHKLYMRYHLIKNFYRSLNSVKYLMQIKMRRRNA
jgi:poly-gamma-glutamate synthesis protein (capsule biosynthesis protein)